MKRIEITALLAAGLRACAAFLIIDFILESIIENVFGITIMENIGQGAPAPVGLRFHIVNIVVLFLELLVIMGTYVVIRPGFTTNMRAALVTSGIFILFSLLFLAHFVNFGMFPLKMYLIYLVFNVIELPLAVLAGVSAYRELP